MSSDCSLGHYPVLDHTTGTVVCSNCAHVLDEGLSYAEVNLQKHNSFFSKDEDSVDQMKIEGEPIKVYLEKIGDKLHLSQATLDNVLIEFSKNHSRAEKMVSTNQKNKRLLRCRKLLLVYTLYNTLKKECTPRSIKVICYYANVSSSAIHIVEKFFDSNTSLQTTRLKPISAKDILYTHYNYIENMTFEDVGHIIHLLNAISPCSFTATTQAAGLVYIYMNYIKKSKETMTRLSTLFGVTTMSIHRFKKRYKTMLIP